MKLRKAVGKPRFSILTLLLLTALVALAVSHIRLARQLSQTRRELTVARNELSYLDADDAERIYAVALPTYGPMQWRWRVQLPKEGRYRICSSFGTIPESGLPADWSEHSHVFLDSRARPLPGGEPFILALAIHKNESGEWVTTIQTRDRGEISRIDNPPHWLDAGSFLHWSTSIYGRNKTVSAEPSGPLMLLKYRKSKEVPGGVTVDMQPTDGMVFWIEWMDPR